MGVSGIVSMQLGQLGQAGWTSAVFCFHLENAECVQPEQPEILARVRMRARTREVYARAQAHA
jgi:hypothetical protein